jgi:hypothetical protein
LEICWSSSRYNGVFHAWRNWLKMVQIYWKWLKLVESVLKFRQKWLKTERKWLKMVQIFLKLATNDS